MAKTDRAAKAAQIKIVKKRDGSLGWRIRDENGVAVKPTSRDGKPSGIESAHDNLRYKASVQAIQRMLRYELAMKRRMASKLTTNTNSVIPSRKPAARPDVARKPG